MTRLREDDLYGVGDSLAAYDRRLRRRLGQGLAGIAAHAVGRREEDFAAALPRVSVAVVPVAYGEGLIGGFAQTVRDIVAFLGCEAFVTERANLPGLSEAVSRGAQVIFLADDDDFVALCPGGRRAADNGEATGRGYAAALDLLAGGVAGRPVLVVGAGPVGTGAARFLAGRGAAVTVYDREPAQAARLRQLLPAVAAAPSLAAALAACPLVLEATPAAATLPASCLTPATLVAAPGIPLGVDERGRQLLGERLLHDVLEIGVATMLFTALSD